jgi:hypothetical protein
MMWTKMSQKRMKLDFLAKYFRIRDMTVKTNELPAETIRYSEAPFLQSDDLRF